MGKQRNSESDMHSLDPLGAMFSSNVEQLRQNEELVLFVNYLAQVTHQFGNRSLQWSESEETREDKLLQFTSFCFGKLMSDGWGFLGCLERASLLAAAHHVRASLETACLFQWVANDPKEREERLGRFDTYSRLGRYLHAREFETLGIEVKSASKFVESIEVDTLNKWANTFRTTKSRLDRVKWWYYPDRIGAIMKEVFDSGIGLKYEDGMSKVWGQIYAFTSVGTHLSPLHASVSAHPVGIDWERESKTVSDEARLMWIALNMSLDTLNDIVLPAARLSSME